MKKLSVFIFTVGIFVSQQTWADKSSEESSSSSDESSSSEEIDKASVLMFFPNVERDTHFHLYTRDNLQKREHLHLNMLDSLGSFRAGKPVKVIIHGFCEHGSRSWMIRMKNEFLNQEDANVIIVDWRRLALFYAYNAAATNARKVGAHVGDLLNWLINNKMATRESIHIIGFSLGAHTAGIAAKHVKGGKIARVTGLDPAYPLFALSTRANRIDKSDARFVDIMHTNSGVGLKFELSFSAALGHVDFYPNGGSHQPGCVNTSLEQILEHGIAVACSHNRAPEYFIESIANPDSFWSYACRAGHGKCVNKCTKAGAGCNRMGYQSDPRYPGVFYLDTESKSPYSISAA